MLTEERIEVVRNQVMEALQGARLRECDRLPDPTNQALQEGRLKIEAAADLAAIIDHTLLKPEATSAAIEHLCAEAKQHNFAAVCVNPYWVPLSRRLLAGGKVRLAAVVGFPLGATLSGVKAAETEAVVTAGADEVDMVINIGELKAGHYLAVFEDIRAVVDAAHVRSSLVKVIIETALLTDQEKVAACILARAACADTVKTSTGFSSGGAMVEDVALMRLVVGPDMGVKAAGGISNTEKAMAMVAAGASRIGASAGLKLIGAAR